MHPDAILPATLRSKRRSAVPNSVYGGMVIKCKEASFADDVTVRLNQLIADGVRIEVGVWVTDVPRRIVQILTH